MVECPAEITTTKQNVHKTMGIIDYIILNAEKKVNKIAIIDKREATIVKIMSFCFATV